jgi:predicted nucleic acid-binding protein
MKFRIENRKQNLSFFDCAGYVFAMENGMTFVTGDREFRNMKGVEFVS